MGGAVWVGRARQAIGRLPVGAPWPVVAAEIVAELRRVVGFDCFCAGVIDPRSGLPAAALADNDAIGGRQRRFWQIELQLPDVNKSVSLVRAARPVAVLSAATGGDLARSARWDELLGPGGIGDELRAGLVADGHWWGSLVLYRERRCPRFSAADTDVVAELVAPMAAAARGSWTVPPAGRVGAAEVPGTLLVDTDGGHISATPAAQRWLRRLHPVQRSSSSIVYALVARLGAAAPGYPPVESVRSLVRGIDGSWIDLTASRLAVPVSAAAVTVTVQAARPEAVADLLLRAYGFTGRERQVAELAMAGRSAAEIGAQLFLSRHTVTDYLKTVFAKTGVHSRTELTQRLTGLGC